MQSWSLYPAKNGLGEYQQAWDRLNAFLFAGHPYFDSKFIAPLLKYFSNDQVQLCVHRSAETIDGMLLIEPKGPAKWSVFTPAQAQITPLLLTQPQDLRTLLPKLPGLLLGLDFPCQDPCYSPLDNTLPDWQSAPVQHALTINIRLDNGSFDDYLASRTTRFRNNLSRRFKKVREAGYDLCLKQIEDPEQMHSAITRFGDMESKGWKQTQGTAVHVENVQGHFYQAMMENFAGSGQACVYELMFGGESVAMELCILSAEMLILLKTAHDPNHACYSPGRLLLYLLLKQEFALKRVKTVEFYTNADVNELAWAEGQRWIKHHMLLRNKLLRYGYQVFKG